MKFRYYVVLSFVIPITYFAGFAQGSPDYMGQAVERIQQDVTYSESVLEYGKITYNHEHIVALAVLGYVEAIASAPSYGYKKYIAKNEILPADNAVDIIKERAGICGNAYALFLELCRELDVKVRSAQFYYGDNTHIAAEVWYNNEWHYYDPTWGVYYKKDGKILSVEEIRALDNPNEYVIENASLLWRRVQINSGIDVMKPVYDKDTNVIYGD